MRWKRLNFLVAVFILITLLSSQFVSADIPEEQPQKFLYKLVTLSFLQDIGFKGSADPLEGTIRFMILILVFALLFGAGEFALPRFPKNIIVVITLVISIIASIFIPGEVILAAATGLGTLLGLFLVLIPVGLGILLFVMLKEEHLARATVSTVLLWVMWQMIDMIDPSRGLAAFAGSQFSSVLESVQTLLWIGFALVALMMAWSWYRFAAGFGGADEYRPNALGRFGRKVSDRVAQAIPGTRAQQRHVKREKTRLLNDIIVEKKEHKVLEKVNEDANEYSEKVAKIMHGLKVESFNEVISLNNTMKNLNESFRHALELEHGWEKHQRRESSEIRVLIKEMAKNNVPDKVLNDMKLKEKELLTFFAGVKKSLGSAKKMLTEIDGEHLKMMKAFQGAYGEKSGRAKEQPYTLPDKGGLSSATFVQFFNLVKNFEKEVHDALDYEEKSLETTSIMAENIKNKWIVPQG